MPRCASLLGTVVLGLTLGACAPKAPPPAAGHDAGGPLRISFPPESVEIDGPIPRDVVMSTMESHATALSSCVPRGAAGASGGRVTVHLRLTIGPDGRVRRAVLHESDAHDRSIDRCMVSRAKGIHFPNGPARATSVASMRVVVSAP
jgi:hypothetical protein